MKGKLKNAFHLKYYADKKKTIKKKSKENVLIFV